ncbi:MAG: hypothetical protein ACYDIC_10750 [Desulfobaccales bacterium]
MGRLGKLWLASIFLAALLVSTGPSWGQKLPPTKLEFGSGSQQSNKPSVQQQSQQNQVQQQSPRKIKKKQSKDSAPKSQGPAKPMRGAPAGASRQ